MYKGRVNRAENKYSAIRENLIYNNLINTYSIETIENKLIDVANAYRMNYLTNNIAYLTPKWIKKFDPRLGIYLVPVQYRKEGVKYIVKHSGPSSWVIKKESVTYCTESDLFREMAMALNRILSKITWGRICKKFGLTKLPYIPSFGEFAEECVKSIDN